MTTAFIGHARQDRAFARELAEFLEFGCDLTCYADDGLIGEDQDLISKAEEGLSADVLLLLLTRASSPSRWVRERWERVLFDEAKRGGVDVIPVLLEECFFPQLLRRRGNFVDATANWLTARRLVKRWCWSREHGPGASPGCEVSSDLEHLYSALSDRAGLLEAGGADTWRFASEAEQEFELVLWVPCQGRTVAQAAGELGRQLGLRLDGPVNQNCRRIRDLLAPRRCLVVLDAPTPEIVAELIAGGRTSTAVTRETVRTLETPATPAYARELIGAGRYAEAYELLYGLLDAVIDPETCARELTWICEHWDRIEEANVLRFNYGPSGTEQLALF